MEDLDLPSVLLLLLIPVCSAPLNVHCPFQRGKILLVLEKCWAKYESLVDIADIKVQSFKLNRRDQMNSST